MMAWMRYRSMYALSMLVGYMVAGVLLALGRLAPGARELIRQQATEHAEAAARKEGPYLAPVWMLVTAPALLLIGLLFHLAAALVRHA